MRYKTKVEFRTNGRSYPPGSVLPENISTADLAFLKSKRFLVPTDETEMDLNDEESCYELFDRELDELLKENGIYGLKSPEEISKIRSKKVIAEYAEFIGLDLGDDYEKKGLKDLQEEVINFQEEEESGQNEEDAE